MLITIKRMFILDHFETKSQKPPQQKNTQNQRTPTQQGKQTKKPPKPQKISRTQNREVKRMFLTALDTVKSQLRNL